MRMRVNSVELKSMVVTARTLRFPLLLFLLPLFPTTVTVFCGGGDDDVPRIEIVMYHVPRVEIRVEINESLHDVLAVGLRKRLLWTLDAAHRYPRHQVDENQPDESGGGCLPRFRLRILQNHGKMQGVRAVVLWDPCALHIQ